jgi:lyso-ornithine lipid O-acyltransferase
LTISRLLSETAKQLRQPATYSKKNLATQWQRSKRVVNLMAAIQTGEKEEKWPKNL